MNNKIKLGLALFIIGFLGILTMLTINIPLGSLPKEITAKFSPQVIKWLILFNPTLFLTIAVVIGTILYDKVGLKVPTISNILNIEKSAITFFEQLKFGILLGICTGILTVLVGLIFKDSIPQAFIDEGSKMKITILARFGYGGFTEELLMRYGFMTLIVWIIFKLNKQLLNATYWVAIVLAALLFAVGHFPIVYSIVENPSIGLLSYVLLGNSIAGIFFGWLYWKKGLEAAFIAHIFAHIVMLWGEIYFQLK